MMIIYGSLLYHFNVTEDLIITNNFRSLCWLVAMVQIKRPAPNLS